MVEHASVTFMPEYYSIVWLDHICLPTHQLTDGCLHSLAAMVNTAVNITSKFLSERV